MTSERPNWWPPDDPEHFYCTDGHDCEEGWFITPGRPGQADTAERCSCLKNNIRERRRRREEAAQRSQRPELADW